MVRDLLLATNSLNKSYRSMMTPNVMALLDKVTEEEWNAIVIMSRYHCPTLALCEMYDGEFTHDEVKVINRMVSFIFETMKRYERVGKFTRAVCRIRTYKYARSDKVDIE